MDKTVLEVIQQKVKTLKFVRTHVRWAGIVTQFVGIFLSSTPVMLVGTLVFLLSYMISTNIIEEITVLVWDKADEKEEDENTTDEQNQ